MNTTLDELSILDRTSKGTFSWIDYSMFILMLTISVIIGSYYGFFKNKQNTTNEYLFGGKSMKIFPVAMSIVASDSSGIALLGVPTDVYLYGATYCWCCIAYLINGLICSYVIMPVFLKPEVGSIFEYLHLRFNNKIRKLACLLYIISVILYNPMVIYIPALALAHATGTNLYFITIMLSVICIFYTTIGGLKGVVWTDTIQTMSIAGSLILVCVLGISSVGGISNIWTKSVETHRLDMFNFDMDPTRRDNFWAPIIGSIVSVAAVYCISPSNTQRFKSVPSLAHAKKVVLISIAGIIMVKLATTFIGLIMYAKYSDCDPISTKQVSKDDQLLPFYVMDVAGHISGLPGLFIAGIVSAGLSTLSTTLNTLSGTIYDDFISPFMPVDTSQKRASTILKLLVVVCGMANILLVLVVHHLGAILPLIISISAVTGGPLLALFTLGLLFPMANSKGALTAGIAGLIFCSWMIFGNLYYNRMGLLDNFAKPISVDGCDFFVNSTIKKVIVDKPFLLYRISCWYHLLVGTTVTISIGLIISWLTRKRDDPPVNRGLLSPVIHLLLSKNNKAEYVTVDTALNLVIMNSEPK